MIVLKFIKFIFAWIVTTLLWLGIWMPFYLLGYISTWLGLLFCNRNSEHMAFPWWFWDNIDGINGTLEYKNLNWVYICNPEVNWKVKDPIALAKKIVDSKQGNERKYKNRWTWVTFRNPVTNLSLYLIGVKITNPVTSNTYNFGPFVFVSDKSGFLWTYAFTIKYNNERGFFYSFGWKFTDPSDGRARFLYRISPYKQLS